jgi:1-aminocyclopropane-1-carboxylate deaminase/D-cysteine desulfhydrase-like pyridoxal-dependent ACC family enzyme
VVEAERSAGEKPYLIPAGASSWPGLLGSIELGFELARQVVEQKIDSPCVVVAAGSGGTSVGIAIAAELLQLSWQVIGICIGEGAAFASKNALALREQARRHLKLAEGSATPLEFSDIARGSGYAQITTVEMGIAADAARCYGIILDPVYVGKVFLGLKRMLESGRIERNRPVILVHTGGQMGLFDSSESLNGAHRATCGNWLM